MSHGSLSHRQSADHLDDQLNSLRRRLAEWPTLSRILRAVRALIHFGPWQSLFRRLVGRLHARTAPRSSGDSTAFDLQDSDAIATQLQQESVAIIGVLPQDLLGRFRAITDRLPVGHYELMHEIDEDVRLISDDSSVKSVLRAYFNSEPVLLESTLVVTDPRPDQPPALQNRFHFDFAGWQSLNVMVYLTDVSNQSSAHVIAKGSHRQIRVRDALRGTISDEEAMQRFGSLIQTITGPAGTVFIENTEAFHRRIRGSGRRVMLNLLYASHRGCFANGRTSRGHRERRAQLFAHLRDSASAAQPAVERH